MKKSYPFKGALVSSALVLLFASVASAQLVRGGGGTPKSKRPRTAVVARGEGGRLELVKEKSVFVRSMQRAFNKVGERATVRDVSVRTFEKVNFLAVKTEGGRREVTTLFIQLETVGGSGPAAFHHTGPHVVTCVVNQGGCAAPDDECVVLPGGAGGNTMPGGECRCWSYLRGYDPNRHACNFKINKTYTPLLLSSFDAELPAAGLVEATEEGAGGEGGTRSGGPKSPRPRK